MKCKQCNSEWNSSIQSDKCPFCGAELKTEEEIVYTDIQSAICFVVSKFGKDVYQNEKKFFSILSDYSTGVDAEKRLLKLCLESGAVKKLLASDNGSSEDRHLTIQKTAGYIEEQYFIKRENVIQALSWIAFSLGWNTVQFNSETESADMKKESRLHSSESMMPYPQKEGSTSNEKKGSLIIRKIFVQAQNSPGTSDNSMDEGQTNLDFIIKDGALQRYAGSDKKVIIPSDVVTIGSEAFKGCNAHEIIITEGVKGIEKDAFYGCKNLISMHIPATVSYIAGNVFEKCVCLETISVATHNGRYSSAYGVLFAGDLLIAYPEGKIQTSYTIPSFVTVIGNRAFANNCHLKYVQFSEGPCELKKVEDGAFYNCKELKTVNMPHVYEIGIKCFYGCDCLNSISLPDSVRLIGNLAFENCSNLQHVFLPIHIENFQPLFEGTPLSFFTPNDYDKLAKQKNYDLEQLIDKKHEVESKLQRLIGSLMKRRRQESEEELEEINDDIKNAKRIHVFEARFHAASEDTYDYLHKSFGVFERSD